jgi:biopolymer transport protein ExbD
VLIKADADVDYGSVMKAFDQLRLAAVESIGLITDPHVEESSAGGGR